MTDLAKMELTRKRDKPTTMTDLAKMELTRKRYEPTTNDWYSENGAD